MPSYNGTVGSIPISRPEPRSRINLRKPLLPLASALLALVAAVVAVYFLTQSDEPPFVVAGNADDFEVGEPVRNAEHNFYIVKLDSGEFLALYQKDPHLGCTVPWRPDFEFQGKTGYFRNPCHGETYDIEGNLLFGPAPRGLDRFPVEIVNGEVRVDTETLICGPGAPPGMVCTP